MKFCGEKPPNYYSKWKLRVKASFQIVFRRGGKTILVAGKACTYGEKTV
jgi:hypothetical protein